MNFEGFCGPSYASESALVDCESLINMYTEIVESGRGRNPDRLALYPAAGSALWVDLTGSGTSVRALHSTPGKRSFAVLGTTLQEINSDRTATARGTITTDTVPNSMVSGDTYALLASGGSLYTFDLSTNTLAQVSAANLAGSVSQV